MARKNGLLALEEKANQQDDPFFKQAIMLIVDANDADTVSYTHLDVYKRQSTQMANIRSMLENISPDDVPPRNFGRRLGDQ